jgi:2-methylisocitrate lyase-like PEP mutase family enzyme
VTDSSLRKTTQLRRLVEGTEPFPMVGTYDALTARIAERCGFPVIYATGYGISATLLGMPDVGLLTATEMLGTLGRICDVVDRPVVADGDTCYGNYVNATRLAKDLIKAGAAGVHIEDQAFPKRCGHMDSKRLVPPQDMIDKIKAIVDARTDPDFVLIARTDAIAVENFEAALDRAEAFIEAGADVAFVEAPENEWQMREIPKRLKMPLMYNASWDGKSPLPSLQEIGALGYRIISYPDVVFATTRAVEHMYSSILNTGFYPAADRMAGFREFNELVGLDKVEALDNRYGHNDPNRHQGNF